MAVMDEQELEVLVGRALDRIEHIVAQLREHVIDNKAEAHEAIRKALEDRE